MAEYAPVGPYRFMNQLEQMDALGDYHLLIVDDVVRYPVAYEMLYAQIGHEGRTPFVILDNGVIETGRPAQPAVLFEIAARVKANCVVAPDVLQDFAGTRAAMTNFMQEMASMGAVHHHMMVAPQGSTIEQIRDCIKWLRDNVPKDPRHDFWGVPRWIANAFGTRLHTIDMIRKEVGDHVKIHLLGQSRFHMDDVMCCREPNVMGIDSANPLVLGLQGVRLSSGHYIHADRGAYWDEPEWLEQASVDNVRYFREIVRG